MPVVHGYTYKQLIRPLLLSTRLSKGKPEAAGYLAQRRRSATVLPKFGMIYCAQKHLPKMMVISEKIMLCNPYELNVIDIDYPVHPKSA